MVLGALQLDRAAWTAIQKALRRFHPRFQEVKIVPQGGTVQLFVLEDGLEGPIPASRLSDGTLRYLALVAVLLHPRPPPLICIEEPELGLHPDLIDDLAKLLVDASTRCQVVVTTHSDHLVNALSASPEAVVVVEREEGGTALRRLDPVALAAWTEKYRLGELWMKGELGGTRW